MAIDWESEFKKNNGKIIKCIRKKCNSFEIAEEVSGEAWHLAWKLRDSFSGACDFRWWVRGIALNCLWNYLRKQNNKPHHHLELDPELFIVIPPAISELEKFLSLASPEDRDLLTARFLQEKSMAEISSIVGIPESTVRVNVFRAVRRIRNQISVPQSL